MFRKKNKKQRKVRQKANSVNKEIVKRAISDNDVGEVPFQDALKEKFNAFKKFTDEIFTNKKSGMLKDERAVASDEEHLNDQAKLKRKLSRELARGNFEETKRQQSKKKFVQIKQK